MSSDQPINKNYEQVFCPHCITVTACITKRLIDGWQWICSICGSIADTEYDPHIDDDWDDDLNDDLDDDWDDDYE